MKTNSPFTSPGEKNHYVVVKEKNGGSSSSSAKGTQNAEKVTVLGQRSTKTSNLPHYMNGSNASIFGNRLRHSSMQAGIEARQNAARAAQQYHVPTGGNMFSGGLGSADAGMMMAMQALNGGMGLIGQGLSAFKAPAQTQDPATQQKQAPAKKQGVEDPGNAKKQVVDSRSVIDPNGNADDGGESVADEGSTQLSATDIANNAISGMKSAQTPAQLRQAITAAEGQLDKSKIMDKEKLAKAKESLKKASDEVKAKEQSVSKLNGQVKETQAAVESQKKMVAKYEEGVKAASTAYKDACDQVDLAEKSLSDLKSQLADDPDNMELITQVGQAEVKLKEAQKTRDKALEEYNTAEKGKDESKATLQTQLTKLDQFKKSLREAESNKKKAENELAKARENETKLKTAIADSERNQHLEKKIVEYKTKLNEMVKLSENKIEELHKQITTTNAEINDRSTRIDVSDGVSVAEKIRMDKNENAATANQKRTDKMEKLIQDLGIEDMTEGETIILDNKTFEADGNNQFRIVEEKTDPVTNKKWKQYSSPMSLQAVIEIVKKDLDKSLEEE